MDSSKMKLFALLGALLGMKPRTRKSGNGAKRAQERLAAKRKANAVKYQDIPERQPSRQVLRRMARQKEKSIRSEWKRSAMTKRIHGGSAIVR